MSMKHKIPAKRASSLLAELSREECAKLKKGREYPEFRAGDSIQIDHLPYKSSNEPIKMRGVVIAKSNKLSDSSVTLLNSDNGTPYIRRVFLYSPLVTNITVLQKGFITKGKKRVKRAKLYYLTERKPDMYTVN
jgi:large subunit ribosomal protein L19